eukprot:245361-Pleurochrysis_carterae.AAC.1
MLQHAEHRLRAACAAFGATSPVGSGVSLAEITLLAHVMLARDGCTPSRPWAMVIDLELIVYLPLSADTAVPNSSFLFMLSPLFCSVSFLFSDLIFYHV